jgi:hypothetical protein
VRQTSVGDATGVLSPYAEPPMSYPISRPAGAGWEWPRRPASWPSLRRPQERAKLDIAEARRAAAEQAKQPEVNKGDQAATGGSRPQNQIGVTTAKIITLISSSHPSSEKMILPGSRCTSEVACRRIAATPRAAAASTTLQRLQSRAQLPPCVDHFSCVDHLLCDDGSRWR